MATRPAYNISSITSSFWLTGDTEHNFSARRLSCNFGLSRFIQVSTDKLLTRTLAL